MFRADSGTDAQLASRLGRRPAESCALGAQSQARALLTGNDRTGSGQYARRRGPFASATPR